MTHDAELGVQDSRAAIQRASMESLPLAAAALTAAYLVFGLAHLAVLPPAMARVMVPVALGSAALYGIAWRWLGRHPLPLRLAPSATFAGSLLMLANCAAHLLCSADLDQSTNFMVHVIGWSCLLLDARWQAAMLASTWATWCAIALPLGEPTARVHFFFALLSSSVLGLALARLRRKAILRYETQLQETRRAREAAEAADRVKALFLATMSHEVRTPMNGILATTDLLQHTHLTAHQRDLAGMIERSGRALLDLLTNVLEYSRRDGSRLEVERREFGLLPLLREVVARVGGNDVDPAVSVRISISPDLPLCFVGDERHLRQILTHLVGNAFKFTPAGSIQISVAAARTAGRVRFEVVDTGIGIRREDQARLFLPFEQADGSTSRSHGGAGLGLARSRQIVEALGGTIGLESERGSGTKVWFELPLDADHGSVPKPAAAARASRVLVAAPAGVQCRIITRLVERAGASATVVSDRAAVLHRLEKEPFEVLLVEGDLMAEGDDGLIAAVRTAESAGRLAGSRPLRIAVMTSESDAGTDPSWTGSGADAVLNRPFGLSALQALWTSPITARPDPQATLP